MTCKTPDDITHQPNHRSFSKVWFLLPTLFLSLSSIAFLLFLLPVHFVLAYSPVSSNAIDAATNDDSTGALDVTGGEYGVDKDYDYERINVNVGVLKIHPRSSSTEIEVKNKNYSEEAKDCIQITSEATVKLAGVNIKVTAGDGIDPVTVGTYGSTYNVKILLVDGTENILKPTGKGEGPGVWKLTTGNLTIGVPEGSKGTGKLDTTGAESQPGIGAAAAHSTSNITITGGTIIAKGGGSAAGIGGGEDSIDTGITTSDITITGGNVTAFGGAGAAGIGGGRTGGDVSNIQITGGVVTAIGGLLDVGSITLSGSGIGGGGMISGTVSGNKISGNAVVMAASAGDSKAALEGFDNSDITNCIVFTGVGTAFDSQGRATAESWTESEMHDNVVLSKNLEIPTDLTVPSGQILSIEKDKTVALTGKDAAKYTVEGELQNNGTVTLPTNLECGESGKVTTLLDYDPQGGSIKTNDDNYITFQDASGIKTYENLPNAEKEGYDLVGWYTKEEGQGRKVEKGDVVLLNDHTLYAAWREVGPSPEPTPDIKEGWELDDTGWRYFVNNDAITGWKWIDDTYGAHWYFFGEDTYMVSSSWLYDQDAHSWYWVCSTGPMITSLWQWIDNEWYGFYWDGKMCPGWVWDTDWNAWFYCYQNGIMARSTWIDAYWVDWRGVWLH